MGQIYWWCNYIKISSYIYLKYYLTYKYVINMQISKYMHLYCNFCISKRGSILRSWNQMFWILKHLNLGMFVYFSTSFTLRIHSNILWKQGRVPQDAWAGCKPTPFPLGLDKNQKQTNKKKEMSMIQLFSSSRKFP